MENFVEEQRKYSLNAASAIKGEIYSEDCYIPFEHAFYMDESVLKTSFTPKKFTLLHDYISYRLREYFDYDLKKMGSAIYSSIYEEFECFGVDFKKYEEYSGNDYRSYLNNIFSNKVIDSLAKSTFNILFSDRTLMKEFNLKISYEIKKLNFIDYPLYLARDGVMKRYSSWPKWLRSALLRREQGHCAICQTDLTGLISNNVDGAIDHLIPLNLGGTNDPTNLQLLCKRCNSEKGGNKLTSSDRYSQYW
ncbi:HNH endonuclease signature motif containing protein [Pectobacterium aroidearum]|uniref:HNH endonuclease n=1 Tax=Pectobacterium aroidearum TaxID=1201031 RepID=UPI0031592B4B